MEVVVDDVLIILIFFFFFFGRSFFNGRIRIGQNKIREILMNALRVLVYELFLETFYEKMIKQLIFLTIFYISHKSNVKNLKLS